MERKKAYLSVGPNISAKDVETLANYLEDGSTELIVPQRDLEQWGEGGAADAKTRMKLRLQALSGAVYLIGEFSYPSRQAFFEAGFAHALGKPIVAIHRSGTTVSEEVEAVCAFVVEYEDHQDLMQKMKIGANFELYNE